MRRVPLHWQILIGMLAGLLLGYLALQFDVWRGGTLGKTLIVNWIKPFGLIFINLLKLIAIPLIITSLIKGISDLNETSKLSSLGLRTVAL